MRNNNSDQVQIWLELLCQMVPGIAQAVLVQQSNVKEGDVVHWPSSGTTRADILTAASLAASQNKIVTTTMSSAGENDSSVDTIIALPISHLGSFKRTLAVLVNVKPSQQATIIQILRWGEKWLGLLPSLQRSEGVVSGSQTTTSSVSKRFHSLRSGTIALAVLVIVCILGLMNGTYRVTAPANLEGRIQRAIVAPFDGYVAAAHARAGKTVQAGEIIAELDTEDLVLQQQRYTAEINEYDHEYRSALSLRDKTQAHIYKSRVSQAEAQLQLLDKKIERSTLVSTLDGIIISGDLSRSLGAPVKTGDVLFEVAPLDEYRLIILVDEKQVVDVSESLTGTLSLKAMPGKALPFEVHKVSPVFAENEKGIAYRIEARLVEPLVGLRPGMEGFAKIDIDQRRLVWIYFHEIFDLLRLWVWRWLP